MSKLTWWQRILDLLGLWKDASKLPDGYIQIGKIQCKKNKDYPSSGHPESENWDTATVKPRSSDGQLKNSPPHPFCMEQIEKGRKDTDLEVAYFNTELAFEYTDRAQRVAEDDEVAGRTKWNYRRKTGCRDLCQNVLLLWVLKGTKVKQLQNGDLRVDSELHLTVPNACNAASPQHEIPYP